MATIAAPGNRSGLARNRSALPSAVAAPATPPPYRRGSQVVDNITDVIVESAPEAAQLPSLLEEAETLARSFEALQSRRSVTRQEGSQERSARRAKQRGRSDAHGGKLPVFSSDSSTRKSRQTASLASARIAADSPSPVSLDTTHITAGLSARRTQQARSWGKAKSDQQVEHTWNGIATPTRGTSLKHKEEIDLTTRLKKYFKLKSRYDALTNTMGYSPSMEEFARCLGTDKVSTISAIMTSGPRQKAAMVRHNMGLVMNIVAKYENPFVTREEMTSSAVEGLVHAVKLFDPSKGFKFSTYAHWWVRQSVNKVLAVESRVVYIPQNVYEQSVQASSIAAELAPKYHPSAVPNEAIAAKMGVSVKRLQEVRSAIKEPVSMNAPIGSADTEIGESVSDGTAVKADDVMIEDSMEQVVESCLRQLPARDAGVLRMRYGLGGFERPHTLEEIGFRYAVTRERIRQIETKAFGELRRSSANDDLEDYTVEQDEDLTRTSSAVGKKSE